MTALDSGLPDRTPFALLIERVRLGDEAAIAELIGQYERIVLRSVRVRIGKPMRCAMDSMDVMQSVHRSLLMGLRHQKFDVSTPEQLIGLAVIMVRRKVARHWRKLKHQPGKNTGADSADGFAQLNDAVDAGPTPSDVAAASDLHDQIMGQLPQLDREIVELRLNGHSTAEVAHLIGQDPAYLRMRLSRIRRRLRDGGLMEEWL